MIVTSTFAKTTCYSNCWFGELIHFVMRNDRNHAKYDIRIYRLITNSLLHLQYDCDMQTGTMAHVKTDRQPQPVGL